MTPEPTLADLPIEVQEEIKRLLYNQGEALTKMHLAILYHLKDEPQTIPEVAELFKGVSYYTVRRHALDLVKFKLLHPVAKKGKAPVYLVATSDYQSTLLPPKGMVKLRGRELTLQELAFMFNKAEYIQGMTATLSFSLIPLAPLPLSVRLMYENMLPQFIEIVTVLEKLIQMPIYDDSVGAYQYLGTFNEDILEYWGDNFHAAWVDGTITTKGFKVNFEVAKRMHEVIEKAREALGKNKLTEEEILSAD
jgi:hypothetical protein